MNDRSNMVVVPIFNGNLVLWGYDTKRDLNKAKKDIERMLMILSSRSVDKIIEFLAPYREKIEKIEARLNDNE